MIEAENFGSIGFFTCSFDSCVYQHLLYNTTDPFLIHLFLSLPRLISPTATTNWIKLDKTCESAIRLVASGSSPPGPPNMI